MRACVRVCVCVCVCGCVCGWVCGCFVFCRVFLIVFKRGVGRRSKGDKGVRLVLKTRFDKLFIRVSSSLKVYGFRAYWFIISGFKLTSILYLNNTSLHGAIDQPIRLPT